MGLAIVGCTSQLASIFASLRQKEVLEMVATWNWAVGFRIFRCGEENIGDVVEHHDLRSISLVWIP